jgi:hypothetical protein
MNNAGSPDPTPKAKRGCLSSPLGLTLLGVLLVISAMVLLQAIPLLYAIAFPPVLSVPEGTTLVRHTQYTHGVDEWVYSAPIKACQVADFLQKLGIECAGAYGCGDMPPEQPESYSGFVTQCYGQQTISMFKVQWTVMLNPDPNDGMKSIYQVYREMFWGGQIPNKRFADILEEIDIQTTMTAQAPMISTLTAEASIQATSQP